MADDLTLRDVVSHMRVHASEFRKELQKLELRLSGRIDSLDNTLNR